MKKGILVYGENGFFPHATLVNSLLEEALKKGVFPDGEYDVSVLATQQSNANKQEIASAYAHAAKVRGWSIALNFDEINFCSVDIEGGSRLWLVGPRV